MYIPAPSLVSLLCSPQGQPVPLMGVSISGEVFGAEARILVRQRYRNQESRPIEAIYTFPLPSDAALTGFAMECQGRRIEGEVKEREEAFEAYDEAVARGHGAALLDQERRNVFTASVGNLLPGEETVIEVAYVQRLGADEGALRLMIPTLVAPRYIPGAAQGDRTGHGTSDPTDRVPDADRITPAIGAVRYGLSIDIVFDLGRDVSLESPSHSIEVLSAGGQRRRVVFRRDTVPLDRDLVLLASGVPGASGVSAGVVAERRRGQEGTFALTVVPDLFDRARRAAPRDVVFLVDVSGSMDGESIEQARSAMRLCLRHLAEGDRFQMIAFASSFSQFKSGLVPFTQRTLEEADRWIASLNASGGTEMLEPLLAGVRALGDKDARRSPILVLLTDGQVGNEAEIVERVAQGASGVRIYTFGIGTNVSDLLLRDLAKRTRGDVEFIHPGERIDEKVTAQFARATAPRVEDVSVRWTGVDAGEIAPSEPPALVDGEPWVVYGRYSDPGIGRAEIRGSLRGEPFFLEVSVELPVEAEREGLAALWASARIRELEDAEAQLRGRRAEGNKKRIVALSVEHRIASKYTSFVVVERRTGDRRAHGQPEARPVPVHGPAGWSMPMPSAEDGAYTRAGTVTRGGFALYQQVLARSSLSLGDATSGGAPEGRARAYASASPAPSKASLRTVGEAVRGAVGRLLGSKGEAERVAEAPAAEWAHDAPAAAPAPMQAPSAETARSTDVTALLEQQLASGLWEGDDGTDAGRLLATARALAICHAAQIDSTHAIFGAPIKKAVEAVCKVAEDVAKSAGAERAIAAAITAAFLVAGGRRLRAQVTAIAKDSSVESLRAIAQHLADSDTASRKLAELGVL